ncbi:MarR family winged helix-turn-helix transcriptional regulator [Kineosporia rhizophila]|uniref:MarR family winged helix-turn-helix transcriptional regulator n=1 Tax=Kineosporia TaxID=49184 RepID=UPI001E392BE7|nr:MULTISPECIES: MarR family winged helix-turn-helix transcriptional regulator [Kineosporia]MCE0535354.1 MarR family winged helix-turn-helix transcriptional regulator [Kineosporia rhizophila]GLY16866.1 MarR family transcriptional regulator [Kineosporia sp. NBRC 101677]
MTGPGPGQTLFGFVRHWSRRSAQAESVAEQGRLVLVSEAVHSLAERGQPATVNAVAYEIGIDQSGASRLVRNAESAGYLRLSPAAGDGRRREASLTAAGLSLLDQAHHWQEEIFAQLTAGWSEQKRNDFQQAMTELVKRSHTLGV